MTTWPSTLPRVPQDGNFTETAPDTLLRSRTDTGPAKVRRRTTAGVRLFKLSFLLTEGQAGDLDAFYNDTLFGGALAFYFPHPRDGTTLSCRFRSPPAFSQGTGGMVRAALELEALP